MTVELPQPLPPPKALQMVPSAQAFVSGKSNFGGKPASAPESPAFNLPSVHSASVQAEPILALHQLPVVVEAPISHDPFKYIASVSPELMPPNSVSGDAATGVLDQGAPTTNGTGIDISAVTQGVSGTAQVPAFGDDSATTPAAAPPILIKISELASQGDIGPYRHALSKLVAENWIPGRKKESVTVAVRLSQDGQVLGRWVLVSSTKRAGNAALAAVDGTEFAPLPAWFRGAELTFRIELQSNVSER